MVSFSDVKDFFNERLRNPFFTAFIFLWIVFNWKGISYFLLSNSPIEYRIENVYNYYSNIWFNHFLPLGLAFISYPIINGILLLIEIISNRVILIRKSKLFNRLAEENKSKEEWAKSKYNLKTQEEGIKQIEELTIKIEKLESENNTLKESNNLLKNDINEGNKKLTELTSKINENTISLSDKEIKLQDYSKSFKEFQSSALNKLEYFRKINMDVDQFLDGVYSLFDKDERQKWDKEYEKYKDLDAFIMIKNLLNDSDNNVFLKPLSNGEYATLSNSGLIHSKLHSNDKEVNFTNKGFYFLTKYLSETHLDQRFHQISSDSYDIF